MHDIATTRWKAWTPALLGAVLLGIALIGAALPAVPAASAAVVSPGAPGAARIWFYRDYEPSVSLSLAPVSLNGTLVGYVQPDGTAFYRDVAPGRYHITVESVGRDVNQARDVELGPGQEAFVKILASDTWESTGGDISSFRRDTFYVSLVPPQLGRAELANHPLGGG